MVGLRGNNKRHFEDLGYYIPKFKNKQGKLVMQSGLKIKIKIEDLPKGSAIKVTKICDDCGKIIPESTYSQIIISRENNDGKDRCKDCGLKYAGKNHKNNVKYEKSLEFYAINNNKEYLLKEFSSNNIKKPNEIAKRTKDEYLWNCPDCKSEYTMKVDSRIRGSSCPYCCVPAKRVNHTNCIWTTHPEVAKLLADPKKGYEITYGSNNFELFKCIECGNVEPKLVSRVVFQGYSCGRCSDGLKYPEKFLIGFLDQTNLRYETQKVFSWSGGRRYDFYISSLNMIIETHGEQHYAYTGFNRSLEEEQENDRLKEYLAKENGIQNYIIIDCRHSELEWIKNNIFNSDISKFINLSNINWLKCHENTCNNLIKKTCILWNEGYAITELIKIMKLSQGTIRSYLKKGAKIGWCDYKLNKN